MIRPARDGDAEGFIALIGACWLEYPGIVVEVEREIPDIRRAASAMQARGGALWAAEQDGRVVGMVGVSPAADGWHVSRMYVEAGQRGTGLAMALLEMAERHARQEGAARMVLWSDLLFERAHRFYGKNGYVRRGGLRALQDLSNTIEAQFEKPLRGVVAEALDVAAAESAERALAQLGEGAWRAVTKRVGEGRSALFGCWVEGVLCGTVRLDLPVEAHRAELAGLLVAEAAWPHGAGLALAQAAEAWAQAAGRWLLVAYVPEGGAAEATLRAAGWDAAGVVPDYLPEGAARMMYRRVSS